MGIIEPCGTPAEAPAHVVYIHGGGWIFGRKEMYSADLAFLGERGLSVGDIGSWVAHPGGPKVLKAMEESLELENGELDVTWRSLREVGNLSSTSVLLVLQETMATRRPPAGSWGMLLALGPGFCSELVLLRW